MYPDAHEEHTRERMSPRLSPHPKPRVVENLKIDATGVNCTSFSLPIICFSFAQSDYCLSVQSPQTPVLSPSKFNRNTTNSQSPSYGQSPLVQDEPSLDDEQFEPILSDEDIIDESDSQVFVKNTVVNILD